MLHFVKNMHIIKDNLFETPPLFEMIQAQSGTNWKEMYKVFNMGHRMEVYTDEKTADEVISISKSFGIDAKIIGHCHAAQGKSLTIKSEFGEFNY